MSSYKKYGEYAQQENLSECSHVSLSVGFALLGVAVGAGIALLFAPKSGGELRGDLRSAAGSAKSRGEEFIGNVRGKVMPFRRAAHPSAASEV